MALFHSQAQRHMINAYHFFNILFCYILATITESSVIKEQPSSSSTTATHSVSTSTTDATTSSSWMYEAKQLGDDVS